MATSKTRRELEAGVEELRKQMEAKHGEGPLTYRVSDRGAVSVYGLMRFTVTLYKKQWEKVLEHQDQLRQFIKGNEAKLKVKKG
jgi:hypothetical protein